MTENSSLLWMILMAILLGIRHGFDLDHLATIDALTRAVQENRILSRCVGCLFSLGHGLLVILISFIIGGGLFQSQVPEWLDGFGNWVSIIFLLVFGFLNLWNVLRHPLQPTLPVGIRSFLTQKIAKKKFTPLMVISIGALFALSFDTVSQIALFSISASLLSGWLFAGILGLFFTLGMIISDGLNGLCVSYLIQRAGVISLAISRTLGLSISLFSLTIGFIKLWKLFFP